MVTRILYHRKSQSWLISKKLSSSIFDLFFFTIILFFRLKIFHSSISFTNKKYWFLNNTCKVMYGYKNSLHNKKLDFSTMADHDYSNFSNVLNSNFFKVPALAVLSQNWMNLFLFQNLYSYEKNVLIIKWYHSFLFSYHTYKLKS